MSGSGTGPTSALGPTSPGWEVDVMLDAVLGRWHQIEAAGEPTYARTNRLSGLRTLPVAFTDLTRAAD